jgi:hypothetical protein
MNIRVLYFDGCPNWKVARQRLHEALASTGRADTVDVSYQTVETPEEAERVGFRGSPTILVDGRDPFADNGPTGGLSCRIYTTEHGPDGAPSVAQLADVLAG